MNIPDITTLKGIQFTEKHFKFHYPEFLEFLNKKYKDAQLTFQEKLYWYFNNIVEKPKCKYCGGETKFENALKGYREYCSYKCLNSDPDKKKKVEKTCLEKFGTKAPAQNRSVVYKMEQTNLRRYGVKNAMQNKNIAEKSHKIYIDKYGGLGNSSKIIREKYKETTQKQYGVENYASTKECREKMKKTCLDKYGVDSYSKTNKFKTIIKKQQPDIREKVNSTKKRNHTFNSSAIEEAFATWLTENNIKFERQYRCPEYPFNCDFYFPSTKLFLEIQGSWVHGGHPYDEYSKDDQAELQEMINKNTDYYDIAIDTWTVRDPLKRKTAKENNLNWIEVFTNDLNTLIENVKSKI